MKKKNTAALTRSITGPLLLPGDGKRAARRSRAAHSHDPAIRILLGKTIEFLLSAGESPEHIACELADQTRRVSSRKPLFCAEDARHVESVHERVVDICGVVHDWHREPAYTNGDGDPLQLSSESLRTLVRKRVPRKRVPELIRWMIKNGVVKNTNHRKFALTGGRMVIFEKDTARKLLMDRVAKLVPQLLRTELRNANTQDPNSRDIHRGALVFFLPEKYVPLWRQVIRERAGMFLESVDNWLEDHARRDDLGPVCEVAVHCYAYTGDSRLPKPARARSRQLKAGG
jgi:hypothetical protein